mmetsp:Transcript_16762/g.23315  ORF Transcript_16762/g.23315 Transcript_16762/m.23315 type:complete len:237 (+) Transcript_16762:1027-1737(+)
MLLRPSQSKKIDHGRRETPPLQEENQPLLLMHQRKDQRLLSNHVLRHLSPLHQAMPTRAPSQILSEKPNQEMKMKSSRRRKKRERQEKLLLQSLRNLLRAKKSQKEAKKEKRESLVKSLSAWPLARKIALQEETTDLQDGMTTEEMTIEERTDLQEGTITEAQEETTEVLEEMITEETIDHQDVMTSLETTSQTIPHLFLQPRELLGPLSKRNLRQFKAQTSSDSCKKRTCKGEGC